MVLGNPSTTYIYNSSASFPPFAPHMYVKQLGSSHTWFLGERLFSSLDARVVFWELVLFLFSLQIILGATWSHLIQPLRETELTSVVAASI